jgi:threonine/homoserine efflux transporter RhtA
MASGAPYAALSGLFWAGLLAAAARAGRRERGDGPTTVTDVVALDIAGAKIGKVIAEDRVTVFLSVPVLRLRRPLELAAIGDHVDLVLAGV